MQRILIVEDNKTLAKLISKKIKEDLKFEIDVAYTLSEAKLFLKRYTYFVALLDLNLPDAPDGEVVDYALSKEQHVIVLSGNIDKTFRQKILEKDIIDYVNKGGINDVNYIINTLQRLEKNQVHKVLVVDDSMVFRKKMKKMLENLFFEVYTVAHGEEALGMLNTHSDFSVVLTDYQMPVMNGLQLTSEIRKTYKKDELIIIAVSGTQDDEINAMFLKNGVNDYIKKPFSKEEFSCRVNNTVEALENLNIVTSHVNRDFLTGLYNRKYFFKHIKECLDEDEQYFVSMIDIDHFEKINKTYGYDVGDKVITKLASILTSTTNHEDIVARFSGKEFCVLLKNVDNYAAQDILERARDTVEKSSIYLNQESIKFTISIGATISAEDSIEENIAQADMMLYKARQNGNNIILFD